MGFLGQDDWQAFSDVVQTAESVGIRLLIGGALALSAYTPLQRRTKDIDFYILPEDRDRTVALLHDLGFRDFYSEMPYDREWIYRSIREGVIADIIWSFANKRALVDEHWFHHSLSLPCSGAVLRVVPPEELLWAKLYVLQRDRCDWPDLLNLLYYTGPSLDWERLRNRLGDDRPLLEALKLVFSWMCPGRPAETPGHLVEAADLPRPREIRADLLDTRPWFLPVLVDSSE